MTIYTMFQQADTAVSAQKQRLSQGFATKGFATGTNSATRLDGVGGVLAQPNALRVLAQSSPNMTTQCSRGLAMVPGMENVAQGNYYFANDASLNVTHATAHATLYYIDSVVVRVKDISYSGVTNIGEIIAVRGTAASLGTVAPPTPAMIGNSYIELAQVTIRPGTLSVLDTDIVDRRHWLTAPGAISIMRAFEEADLGLLSGEVVYRKKSLQVYDSVLVNWRGISNVPRKTLSFDTTAHLDSYVAASIAIPDPGFPYRLRCYGSMIWDQGIDCWYDPTIRLVNAAGTLINQVAGFNAAGATGVSGGISRQITGMSDVITGATTACLVMSRQTSSNAASGVTISPTLSTYNHFFAEVAPEPPA